MENLVKLFYDWEIQQLLLLSFTVQIFLFFTGGLRQRSTNILIRSSIWIAYLGADMVAVYSLGYLSRHADAHPLAFFWAPFLLVHLGGQDTITAFSMEDNSLWLRHLLNLVVQAVLAVYVFWKSIGRHDVGLLVSGAFVFIGGTIRYGERIWSLRRGRYESLEDSPGNQYEPQMNDYGTSEDYYNTVYLCLRSMPTVFSMFVSRTSEVFKRGDLLPPPSEDRHRGVKQRFKLFEIGLGIMYDDLYTKALILRTRSGIILRCTSHICAWIAFVVFHACGRGRYSKVDTSITCSLFIGGLFLDFCGLISFMGSPWTWEWLKARKHDKLAWLSWFLFSNVFIGWPEKRPLWSNVMGQYNFYGWLKGIEPQKPRSFSQLCMVVVRKLVALFGVKKKSLLWMSKLLDTQHVKVDRMILECLLGGVGHISSPEKLPKLGSFLRVQATNLDLGFGVSVVCIHVLTEAHLSKCPVSGMEANESAYIVVLMEECRKLSRYMMYLMVASPSLLPLDQSSAGLLESCQQQHRMMRDWVEYAEQCADDLEPGKETLEELKDLWIRLIVYAASKSRPETHAAQLARGGELLTFVWLQLGFVLGNFSARIEFTDKSHSEDTLYALHLPPSYSDSP
ncbi:unnamed protein product [Urochloa humidicola]